MAPEIQTKRPPGSRAQLRLPTPGHLHLDPSSPRGSLEGRGPRAPGPGRGKGGAGGSAAPAGPALRGAELRGEWVPPPREPWDGAPGASLSTNRSMARCGRSMWSAGPHTSTHTCMHTPTYRHTHKIRKSVNYCARDSFVGVQQWPRDHSSQYMCDSMCVVLIPG